MTKTFTRNDVIRYIYDEMTDQECATFRDLLKVDSQLREDWHMELHLKDQLSKSLIDPPARVTDAILRYSTATQVGETKITG